MLLFHAMWLILWNSETLKIYTFISTVLIPGIKVKYDLSKPPLQRVVEAYAICQNCTVPAYEKIDKGQKYRLILSNFILNGGDGYGMIAKYAEQSHTIGK